VAPRLYRLSFIFDSGKVVEGLEVASIETPFMVSFAVEFIDIMPSLELNILLWSHFIFFGLYPGVVLADFIGN
jgi:hypothetical protein